jgi:hypothetical protein
MATPEDLEVMLALRQLTLVTARQLGALIAVLEQKGLLTRREVLDEMERQREEPAPGGPRTGEK